MCAALAHTHKGVMGLGVAMRNTVSATLLDIQMMRATLTKPGTNATAATVDVWSTHVLTQSWCTHALVTVAP